MWEVQAQAILYNKHIATFSNTKNDPSVCDCVETCSYNKAIYASFEWKWMPINFRPLGGVGRCRQSCGTFRFIFCPCTLHTCIVCYILACVHPARMASHVRSAWHLARLNRQMKARWFDDKYLLHICIFCCIHRIVCERIVGWGGHPERIFTSCVRPTDHMAHHKLLVLCYANVIVCAWILHHHTFEMRVEQKSWILLTIILRALCKYAGFPRRPSQVAVRALFLKLN